MGYGVYYDTFQERKCMLLVLNMVKWNIINFRCSIINNFVVLNHISCWMNLCFMFSSEEQCDWYVWYLYVSFYKGYLFYFLTEEPFAADLPPGSTLKRTTPPTSPPETQGQGQGGSHWVQSLLDDSPQAVAEMASPNIKPVNFEFSKPVPSDPVRQYTSGHPLFLFWFQMWQVYLAIQEMSLPFLTTSATLPFWKVMCIT